MFTRTTGLAVLVLALMIPMTACDTGSDPGFGSVSVLLTDAPGDISEAWVTITDIYLQGQGGETDPPETRVFLLENGEETHELLSLANTVAELVADQVVPTGTYGQLRVILSGGCIVTEDGVYASDGYDVCGPATGVLQMPSFAQTGAKVLLHGLTVSGGQQIILLDFIVSESFQKPAGQTGLWIMEPVIRGAELGLTVGVTVTLSAGDVELPDGFALGDFSATLTADAGDESEVAFEEANGQFRAEFRFLMPDAGPFQVALNAPDGLTVTVAPESPQSVDPASGQTATIDWVLESAEADENEEEDDA